VYIVTFYSFKGGVGRTMALANVAVQLAQSGRRVLAVDFDLEAPGLDTLYLPKPRKAVPGIVEYVSRYLATAEAPDVLEHVYQVEGIGQEGGSLWVMPAGCGDASYGRRLCEIDWAELYADRDGYLLFEDLKAQWRDRLSPDYVLIDSRTGHNDVGGICTRQLPNAVVILFFPNEQNLRGLTKVVEDIKSESIGPRQKSIATHFVMSNVPDLDDEDHILAERLHSFEEALGFGNNLQVIHRYDSLALLNQAVFTKERPRSRLAKEYVALSESIASLNPEDRNGALRFLTDIRRARRALPPAELHDRLELVRAKHPHDGQILGTLATIRLREGRLEEGLALIDEAIEAGYSPPEVLLERAELRHGSGDPEGAAADAVRALESSDADIFDIERSIRLLRAARPSELRDLHKKNAIASCDAGGKGWLASLLTWNHDELAEAKDILTDGLAEASLTDEERRGLLFQLAFTHIGLGKFESAISAIRSCESQPGGLGIAEVFNLAMATWGATGEAPRDLFARVVDLHVLHPRAHSGLNYNECVAVAHWAVGRASEALQFVQRARTLIATKPARVESCWRFLTVSPAEFRRDLDSIAELIEGKPVRPRFMEGAASGVPA